MDLLTAFLVLASSASAASATTRPLEYYFPPASSTAPVASASYPYYPPVQQPAASTASGTSASYPYYPPVQQPAASTASGASASYPYYPPVQQPAASTASGTSASYPYYPPVQQPAASTASGTSASYPYYPPVQQPAASTASGTSASYPYYPPVQQPAASTASGASASYPYYPPVQQPAASTASGTSASYPYYPPVQQPAASTASGTSASYPYYPPVQQPASPTSTFAALQHDRAPAANLEVGNNFKRLHALLAEARIEELQRKIRAQVVKSQKPAEAQLNHKGASDRWGVTPVGLPVRTETVQSNLSRPVVSFPENHVYDIPGSFPPPSAQFVPPMAEPKEATVHPDDFIYKIPGSFPESALVDDDKVLEGQDESHSRNSFLANWFGKLTRSSWSTKPKTSLSETHEGSGSNHSDSEAAKPTLEKENSATLGYPGTPEEAGEKIKSDIDELFKSHPIPPTIEEKAREMIARRKKEDEDRLAQFETANSDRDDRPTQENTDRSPLESSSSPIVPFHGSLQGYNADGTARTTTSAPHLEAEANVMDELAKFNYLIRIDPTGSAATPNPISGQGEDEIATTTPQATGEYYPNLEKLIKDGIITIQEGDNHPLGPIFDTNARMYPQEPEKHVLAINLSRSDELRQIAPFLSIENGELVFDLYKLHDMVRKNIFRAKVYDGQSTMDRPYSPDNMCDDQSSCGVDEENTTRA